MSFLKQLLNINGSPYNARILKPLCMYQILIDDNDLYKGVSEIHLCHFLSLANLVIEA